MPLRKRKTQWFTVYVLSIFAVRLVTGKSVSAIDHCRSRQPLVSLSRVDQGMLPISINLTKSLFGSRCARKLASRRKRSRRSRRSSDHLGDIDASGEELSQEFVGIFQR